jgi:hypothetical protein
MTASPVPPPAYVANVITMDRHTAALLGTADLNPLDSGADQFEVPITLSGTSEHSPIAQAEIAIQDAMRPVYGRETCAVLWRDRDCGTLFVMHKGHLEPVAALELIPAQRTGRAA